MKKITSSDIKKIVKDFDTFESCAVAIGVHSNTLRRWINGTHTPSPMATKRLRQLLNGDVKVTR